MMACGYGLTAGALAFGARGFEDLGLLFECLFEFGLDGGEVAVYALLEQVALYGAHGFAFVAEADAVVMGEFEGQRLDFELGGFEGGVALADLEVAYADFNITLGEGFLGLLEARMQPICQGGIGVKVGEFGGEIHAWIIPRKHHLNLVFITVCAGF